MRSTSTRTEEEKRIHKKAMMHEKYAYKAPIVGEKLKKANKSFSWLTTRCQGFQAYVMKYSTPFQERLLENTDDVALRKPQFKPIFVLQRFGRRERDGVVCIALISATTATSPMRIILTRQEYSRKLKVWYHRQISYKYVESDLLWSFIIAQKLEALNGAQNILHTLMQSFAIREANWRE